MSWLTSLIGYYPKLADANLSDAAWLTSLPDHVLVCHVMTNLPSASLFNLCKTNRRFARLCHDPDTWIRMLISKYPETWSKVSILHDQIIPRDFYLFLTDAKQVPVWYHGRRIGHTYTNHTKNREYLVRHGSTWETVGMPGLANVTRSNFLIRHMFPGTWIIHLDASLKYSRPDQNPAIILLSDHYPKVVFDELIKGDNSPIYGYTDSNGVFHLIDGDNHRRKFSDDELLPCLNMLSTESGKPICLANDSEIYHEIIRQLDLIGHYLGTLDIKTEDI